MPTFRKVAILGTGLIGGSFGLALRRAGFGGAIVGWDRLEVLDRAEALGAIDTGYTGIEAAVKDADLVLLSLPIRTIIELLSLLAGRVSSAALITDTGSTKQAICKIGFQAFSGKAPLFIGGHPMAGKAASGIEQADGEIFAGSVFVIVTESEASRADTRVKSFLEVLRAIGAEPLWMDAETHDWAAAMVSHLPQLVSTAVAGVVADELDEDGLPVKLAGPGFGDVTRLASSPAEIWRDVCLTNEENIGRALDRLIARLEEMRRSLASRELEDFFRRAQLLSRPAASG
jgi:prephenate dehydrogenase